MGESTSPEVETPDRYPGLNKVERANVRMVEAWWSVPILSAISVWMGTHVARRQAALATHNLVEYHNFERIRNANFDNGILLCANHRSYIDNFAIAVRAMIYMPSGVRSLAPARAEGLFDRRWSILVNFFLTYMNIFPPVVRSARGALWGKRVIEILSDLLRKGRVAVFIHPEGGRNKGDDPYKLMTARPGLGRIIHSTRAEVYPVFMHGFPRTGSAYLRAMLRRPAIPSVHAVMGPPIDFAEERARPGSPRLFSEIAQKVNEAIMIVSAEEREIRAHARRWLRPS